MHAAQKNFSKAASIPGSGMAAATPVAVQSRSFNLQAQSSKDGSLSE